MITIGIPNTGSVRSETMLSLIPNLFTAISYYQQAYKTGLMFDMICPVGCYVHMNRNLCVNRALENKSSHLFFVDSDMEFPDDALAKLLVVDKDIVAAPYNKRTLPIRPILDTDMKDMPNFPFRINAMPTGLMLVKMEVFNLMLPPWFAFEFVDGKSDWVGEDIYFCRKAEKYGFEIWCEPTIEVKHIGDYKY